MCGLGGIINSEENVELQRTEAIARQVSFRGPDNTKVILLGDDCRPTTGAAKSAVFFNRLSIIDLDPRSHQPFMNQRYLLIFNGEIYNYKSLKSELASKGVQFITTSDTEVLFHAINTWGEKALSKLNGMFAFFWLDMQEQKFILARDRVGIKPIYYRVENKSLAFASEMDSIVRLSKRKPAVSGASINEYLGLQYVPTPHTILEGVCKLPPGHFVSSSIKSLKEGRAIRPQSFWDGYEFAASRNDIERSGNLEEILKECIQRQLQSDVPLGLFLSSGVDSSLLTAMINKHFKGQSFDLFTVAFTRQTESDESEEAFQYLEGFKNGDLHHHKLMVDPDFMIDKLDSLYDYYDEPFGDAASLLNWVISIKAREHVKVALSGDGADEMFWGYPRYNQWKTETERLYKKIPMLSSAGSLATLVPESRVKYTLHDMAATDPVEIHFNMLRPRLFGFLPPAQAAEDLWCMDGIERISHRDDLASLIDLKAYLPDAMLYKVDRASMASSLEVRVPYLDNAVIDYALKLPLRQKSTAQFRHKAPLKELLVKLAPHYDASRPKRGFNFPLNEWLRNQWKDMVRDTITSKSLIDLGLTPEPFLSIVSKFYRGVDCKNEVWYLLNLVLWHKKYQRLQRPGP